MLVNYFFCLYLLIGQVWLLNKLWFKRYSMHPVSCTNIHYEITDLLNQGMVKNTKTWISWERNITFLWIEKDLNLCLRWHILSSYCFVAEVTLYYQMYRQLWHQCFTYIFHNKIQCKLHLKACYWHRKEAIERCNS